MYLTENTKFTESSRWFYFFSVPSVRSVRDIRCFSAFTLIELLIVIVVISILVSIALPVSKYVARRAREASQKIYIEKIKNALEDYRAAYGEYPITPSTNLAGGLPENYADVMRHYPANYDTYCAAITQSIYGLAGNSPFTNVDLATNTVEVMLAADGTRQVDYSLTYPLMLRQRDEGSRPFMEFKDSTIMYIVFKPKEQTDIDVGTITRWFKTGGGDIGKREADYIRGNPVNRSKAIDPVSQRQWKYRSFDGVTYSLTTNTF